MELTEAEKKAVYDKLENKKAMIKCPRCGALLIFKEFDSAEQIKCETKGCIEANFRGF